MGSDLNVQRTVCRRRTQTKKKKKILKIDDDEDEAILLACESLKVQTEHMEHDNIDVG